MLPEGLQKAVFPDATRHPPVDPRVVEVAKEHLRKHDLPIDKERPALPEPQLDLPRLEGRDIEEHFWRLGEGLGQPYFRLAEEAAGRERWAPDRFPAGFFRWRQQPGWTQYDLGTGEAVRQVGWPGEDLLVFDVETCPGGLGAFPILAVAMSTTSLYAWVSPYLLSDSVPPGTPRLIALGPGTAQESLVIGHNVCFDRAKVAEEYTLKGSKRRFLDTLSMHSAVGGISSQQRIQWSEYKRERNQAELDDDDDDDGSCDTSESNDESASTPQTQKEWCLKGSMANLVDVVRLHCHGLQLDKGPRDLLMKGDLGLVRANMGMVLDYCANDVAATTELFRVLWPRFTREKCAHPVTFFAGLEMASAFLPVDEAWPRYVAACGRMYEEAKGRIGEDLAALAEAVVVQGQAVGDDGRAAWMSDPWLSKLDWTPVPHRFTKERRRKDGSYAKGGEPRPIGDARLFGKPAWYRKLYRAGVLELTPKTRVVPYLLRIAWHGRPVHFIAEAGWCYADPAGTICDPLLLPDDTTTTTRSFRRIPHANIQDGEANVGSLLGKHYLAAFRTGQLSTDGSASDSSLRRAIVEGLLEMTARFSFWIGYRERIRDGQMVVWQDEPGVPLAGENAGGSAPPRLGLILPQILPMGTVTRRAVEATWMTASNPKGGLVGSELKALVRAPPGCVFVGADVDSQELWIAALLGDAQFGFAGSTAVGWMTLQGARADGTDLHSRTAALLGMSRDAAKIFTYGRIYGAGAKYAAQLLLRHDTALAGPEAAAAKARSLYHATKGRQVRRPGGERLYVGGSESFMFNRLEAIARAPVSRTPALSAAISDALLAANVQEEYLTSRINWAVQSSGVDYLHLLLTAMAYLCRRHAIDARLLLTIHDEVRYCVAAGDAMRAALALQVANLWTRAMFVHRLGMAELPLSVAFFGAVDVDAVLRKEPAMDCVTPSNPVPVPPGRSLDIHALLKEVRSLGPGRDGVLPPPARRMQRIGEEEDNGSPPVDQLVDFLRLQAGLATSKRCPPQPSDRAPRTKPAESAAVERGLRAWRTATTTTKTGTK